MLHGNEPSKHGFSLRLLVTICPTLGCSTNRKAYQQQGRLQLGRRIREGRRSDEFLLRIDSLVACESVMSCNIKVSYIFLNIEYNC